MKVMILAAGRGERMRPLTDSTPKPLLQVGGECLIDFHLKRLAATGLTDIVINLAHLGAKIEQHVGDGSGYGLRVRYSREGVKGLETGGGIAHALPLLGPGPFMVVNGDVYTDYDFGKLSDKRLAEQDLAHLVMVDNPVQHPEGDFVLDKGRIHDASGQGNVQLTYSGIGLYRAGLVAGQTSPAFPLAPLLRNAMRAGRVAGEHHAGEWQDIGTPERLAELDHSLRAASG